MQLQSLQYSLHHRGFRYGYVRHELAVHLEEHVEILRRQKQFQVIAVIEVFLRREKGITADMVVRASRLNN